jgi:TonB family protein
VKQLLCLTLLLGMGCATKKSAGFDPPADFFEGLVKEAQIEPAAILEARPVYPEDAKRNEVTGTVRLKVWLDKRGVIQGIRVIQSLGFGLDEAAVEALKQFRFRPAIDAEGDPVPFVFVYSFAFFLD